MMEDASMKICFPVALAFVVMASAFVSQRSIAKEGSMAPMERAAARVAERYVTTHYPGFDTIKNPPIVHDNGDVWEVEYELPSRVIGGTPVVVIEKATLKVLRSFQTQ
jgi:NTF2 fold immunity protein